MPFEKKGNLARSIDRVDPTKGYVDNNVVACTVEFNSKKTNLTLNDIEILFKRTKKYRK